MVGQSYPNILTLWSGWVIRWCLLPGMMSLWHPNVSCDTGLAIMAFEGQCCMQTGAALGGSSGGGLEGWAGLQG